MRPDERWTIARRCGAKRKSKCTKHTILGAFLEVDRKSARPCGAKHISKSKCTKHTRIGAFLEVVMSKKCMLLWREAHFQVKMYKTPQCRTTFGSSDVEKVHAVAARSAFRSQNVQNTPGSEHFLQMRCRKSARCCGAKHISKPKVLCKNWRSRTTVGRSDVVSCGRRKGLCTLSKVSKTWSFGSSFNYNHHYTTPHYITLQLQLQLHYTIYTTLLHYTNYITLYYATLQLQLQVHLQLQLHYTNCTTLHTTLRCTNYKYSYNSNYASAHYTTLDDATLPYITLHYTQYTTTNATATTLH